VDKTDHIEFLAEQLLPQFIPKDAAVTTLSFQFTIAPDATYRVSFVKKITRGKENWELVGYEVVD